MFIIIPVLFTIIWFWLIYRQFRSFYRILIPPVIHDQIVTSIKKEYQPYRLAILSLKTILWEMVKIAFLVFIGGILILFFIYGPVAIPSIFHKS
jgi:hypothetical protein